MKKSDFYYNLPQELIAQHPAEQRDHSRLLCLDKNTGGVEHMHFYDIIDRLHEGDCLIMNDSRVLPARIFGVNANGSANEFLLLRQVQPKVWETITKPGKRAKVGASFTFGEGAMQGTVLEVTEEGNRIVEFACEDEFFSVLDRIGQMPLPPYITEQLADRERYQTVYSREVGSAAAPTAGLHFTQELLERIRAKGVSIGYVTLHVGLGTFRPVKAEEITDHHMHSEHYCVPAETAELINRTRARGGRVIAVGTTSCRTLESCAAEDGSFTACDGWTDIFIYPGYKFKAIDALLTNFHLPESTLIMLVSAFAGYDNTMKTYNTAVEERYRFFSFGDAMFIS
ncbi:MAG: tRNA preQ1(34) S-adenosylmethionine ribosyltransferase-isomerase QueA [Ruminococcaceae bacterium]|nr:tRNA preQ1(34) S-adenosylmethionine ribosyltransferase-isomerase QueA [Oscillospiraceae bacterium]